MNERDLFIAALQIEDTAERSAYLDRACAGETALRQRVEALLAAFEQAGSFLQQPAGDPRATSDVSPPGPSSGSDPAEGPGTVIGPYKLIQQIGEGGMGTVWMAQQTEPVKRLVAVKLIKAGMDSRQVIARFEAERQALALMDHANIARVLEAGTTGAGRPYFVMDLVKGVPITRYCDEHHLTPRQRLELFLPVCQAVQHAHQKGIIHRDLKPSNVLVALYDGQPVPKVIDFGVAKAAGQPLTDKTLVTGFGALVGTLEYMSPEQAEVNQLDIDTRSDIYSLGVLLYELLTGSPPFTRKELEKAGMLEMLRVIREQEPTKPSTKLSTAEGLPTLAANRGTEPAKLTKLVRGELDWIVMKALEKDRNHRYETANGFALDVQRYLADEPVLACPPSAGYRLRKFARRNQGPLTTGGVLALAVLVAVGTIGWMIRDGAARQARATAQVQLNLDEAVRLEQKQNWPEAMDAARRALGLLGSGEVEAEIVKRVQDTIGDLELVRLVEDIRASKSEWNEGDFDYRVTAERYAAAYRDGGIDVERLTAEEAAQRLRSRSAVLAALSPALDDWAVCRLRSEDNVAAFHLWDVAGLVDPDPWRQKLRLPHGNRDEKALRTLAAAPDLARQPATTLTDLSSELIWAGQVDVAIDVLYLAQRQEPADFWVHFWLGLAFTEKSPPNPEQSAACYRAALAVRPRSTAAWCNIGNALAAQKKLDEAVACYKRAIELNSRNAIAHYNLGRAWTAQQKPDDAIDCYRKAIQADPKYAWAHSALGLALFEKGNIDEAIATYKEGIRFKPDHSDCHYNLGLALAAQKRLDEAVACYKRVIQLNPKNAPAHYDLGNTLAEQQKPDDAIDSYRKAIEIDPKYASAHYNLGVTLFRKGELGEAIRAYKAAILLKPEDPGYHHNLGLALWKNGRPDEAVGEFGETIRLKPDHVGAHVSLGAVLCDVKHDYDAAVVHFREAIRSKPDDWKVHCNLGNALCYKGRLDESIRAFREAIRLKPDEAVAHYGLANDLVGKGVLSDEAIAELREAIRLKPAYAEAHFVLGGVLRAKSKPDEAIPVLKEAIRLQPDHAEARFELGLAFTMKGNWHDAIGPFTEAIRLKPNHAEAHYELGFALQSEGKQDEAIAAYRKAIVLKPDYAEAHCNLGQNLRQTGQFGEALAALKKGHELGSRRPDWKHPSEQWLAACERLVELEARLPAILKGQAEPKDVSERIEFAQLCGLKRLYVAEARFHQEILAEWSKRPVFRSEAIRAAALAGCGQGEDGVKLDDAERARWRKQALDWFHADLLAARKHLETGTRQERQGVERMLEMRRGNPDLAALRDAAALAKLPDTERQEWQTLWTEVEALLQQARKAQP